MTIVDALRQVREAVAATDLVAICVNFRATRSPYLTASLDVHTFCIEGKYTAIFHINETHLHLMENRA